jgi:hypothetical protein
MKPSGEATLTVTADQFVLRRPRVFFSRSLYKLWAKWTAVTELEVEPADAGTRLRMTTKARGTGVVVLPDTAPDDLWGVLDGIADLQDRFHSHDDAPADPDGAGTKEPDGAGPDAGGPRDGELGADLTDDAGDGEHDPTGSERQGAEARESLLGEDVSGDAGAEQEQAEPGEVPGPAS